MSYARFGWDGSDVYVYMHVAGHLECCGCILGDEWSFHSTQAMIDHLAEHRAAGHNIPVGIEDELRADDGQNFPPQCADGHDWGEPFQPYPDTSPRITRRRCSRCEWEL